MNGIRNITPSAWILAGVVLPFLLAGCKCSGDGCGGGSGDGNRFNKCADIPAGAIPRPVGSHVDEFIDRQANKAEMDDFVIYLYEWQLGTPNFGPFGARHINLIAHRVSKVDFPVVIEPENDPGLNEARRLAVMNYLQERSITDAMARVVVGFPSAEGLYGEEAPRIYRQMLTPHSGTLGGRGGHQNNTGTNNAGGAAPVQ